jgi:energy-coupling factor transport system ATP-binding protein
MHPDIIVFDEATSMLDPQGKDEINKAIFSIHDNSDITILSITHDIEEVAKSDYVMVMNDGKLIMSGKPKDILVKKDDLVKVHLDTSFAMKLSLDLKAKGIEINEQLDMEGLVDELCRLNSNN